MTAVPVLAIILICLGLILLVRVGIWTRYDEAGFLVRLRVGPLTLGLYPAKPKKKKEDAEKNAAPHEEPAAKGGGFEVFRQMLPVITDAAGQLTRKIRIDDLQMELIWSAPDPAACGMGYGAANAAVGMIWPLLEQNFKIKNYRIRTGVDFDRGSPAVRVVAAMSLTIGQGIGLGLQVIKKIIQVRRKSMSVERPISKTQKKEAG